MTYHDFLDSQTQHEPPAGLSPLLEALWYAGRDEWHKAHALAQEHEDAPLFDWLHAFLHRQQGDLNNAAYWYRRAARPEFDGSLRHEWQELVKTQLPD
ncbi:hypothetical protein [Hymenobacter actinosclerus]|uniref:Uncharacterized protein n=1 Tax=Hymenobacter actinosclerus TaxID=82805 RepID=A0A1I0H429_9BACT|nr:hypothetical protein [Hymenobacter actinosclerus]SET78453.1 hypothetical protein SAMN04487998_2740 [Hymenobacter actinosclerus]